MSSVVIKSVNKQVIKRAVQAYSETVRKEHPEIKKIIWFGSHVNGIPTPGSDVDLCFILSTAGKPYRDRVPDYLPVGFPVGVDLFPYTELEFQQLKKHAQDWYQVIMMGVEV